MEQFSLEKYLENPNRKVVTRDGRPVRIVCWDKLGDYPIIGCIKYSDDYEDFETYNINGSKYSFNREDPNDLFFADEEELTEFESKLFSTFSEIWQDYMLGREIDVAKVVKEYSPELINLARKELEKDIYDNGCRMGYDIGKQDALKDLPKWKKVPSHEKQTMYGMSEISDVYYNGYFIHLDDIYKALPKEE